MTSSVVPPSLINFRVSLRPDRVAVLALDVPGRVMNTLAATVVSELDTISAWLGSEQMIRGAVLVSAKAAGFCAGADLQETEAEMRAWREAATPAAQEEARRSMSRISRAFRTLETCGAPVAAAIHGVALGGGLELALACHYRVAAEEGVKLAFPEATLGLLPGAGGTQRTARLLGPEAALRLLTDGRQLGCHEALELGLVDELAPRDRLVDAGARWILERGKLSAGSARLRAVLPAACAQERRVLAATERRISKRSSGRYPALDHIVAAVRDGVGLSLDEALEVESRHAFATVRTPQATAMLQTLFLSPQRLKRRVMAMVSEAPPLNIAPAPTDGAAKAWRSPVLLKAVEGQGHAELHFRGRFDLVKVVEIVGPDGVADALLHGAAQYLLEMRKLPVIVRREPCGPRLRRAFAAQASQILREGASHADVARAARSISFAWSVPKGDQTGGVAADPSQIAERLLLAVSLEGLRLLEEGLVSDPAALDVLAVQGWSFPDWTGGPAAYVDQVGAAEVLARSMDLAARHGQAFRAPELLHELVRVGGRFYAP